MRACIIGGGLAGAMLAWRLAPTVRDVDVVLGRHRIADATAASGGAVRAYEPDAEQRRLATASMAELLASRRLRDWADYRETGAAYRRRDGVALDAVADEINRTLPSSAHVASLADIDAVGWTGGAVIVERRAGYISPARLRDSVLIDSAANVITGAVSAIRSVHGDAVECVVDGERRSYDIVVIAAGAWTPRVLTSNGLPAAGFRTKSIQYGIYPSTGWRPPHFVDEVTGLYGRPDGGADMLLGLPADHWDADPERPPADAELHRRAVQLAHAVFPNLTLGPAKRLVSAVDCYHGTPTLALRPVINGRLFTFSGGAGGAAKTALAASLHAATQLAGYPTQDAKPVVVGPGEGQA